MKIQEFDFTTPGDWDTPGDGAIVNDQLTLDDSKTILAWNVHHWQTIPTQDGNGDRLITASPVNYRITDDGTAYDLEDYLFVFNLKRLVGSAGSHLSFYHHWTPDVTPTRIKSKFYCPFSSEIRWYIYHSDGFRRTQDQMYSAEVFGAWPEGAFREVRMLFRGATLSMTASSSVIGDHATSDLDMDDTDGGDIAIELLYDSRKWVVGDGEYGTRPSPYLCQRKQGGGQLKVASAWDLSNVTVLGRMMVLGDLTGGGDVPLPVDLRYNHYDGAAWTGWIAPAAGGDISSLSCGSGKKLLVGVTDGSTGGMDTMCDTAFANHQAEYAPLLDAIVVEHMLAGGTVAHRRDAVQAGPRRGDHD